MLADLRGRINTDTEYQRGVVWSEPQQMLLIDSILRGFDLPKIFLGKLPDGSDKLYEVIDGVQRLTSIWRFLSDKFSLPRSYVYPAIGNIGGKTWSELPQDAQDKLQFAKVTVTEIEDSTRDEIRELFQRLQQGEPLNAAERRNAMDVPLRHYVADHLATHRLWPETGIKNKRFGWAEMSAIVVAVVVANGPTGLKAADLLTLYEDAEFDPSGTTADRVESMMDQLFEIARIERGMLRTKWGIVDLLISIMRLEDAKLAFQPNHVVTFYKSFESSRRDAATKLSDLRSTIMDLPTFGLDDEIRLELPEIEPEMLTYVDAFSREGAVRENVAIRSEIMATRLRHFVIDD